MHISDKHLIVRTGWGRRHKIPLADIESVEVEGKNNIARLRIILSGGGEKSFNKVNPSEAFKIKEKLDNVVDPPELKTDRGVTLPEIGESLKLVSKRPGGRASKVMRFIFDQALQHEASDIHLEGGTPGAQVSLRIDGILHKVGKIERDLGERIFTYLKVESGVASYRNDIPQEGAMRLSNRSGEFKDLRISFVPTRGAEKAVVRIFGVGKDKMSLSELGFSDTVIDGFSRMLSRREGMILLTGPSASGKTTTLYASLQHLVGGPRKSSHVISIEDPVECEISGVTQVKVDPRKGMTFAKLLGNMLRQDAEVIMVGEIRDIETAGIAIQAALTGHLILSTIHAGRAPEVIVRLLDLGMESYQVASAISGILSQRLVRKVCDKCREKYQPAKEMIEEYNEWIPDWASFQHGAGCDICYGTGYRGRTAIAEMIEVDASWQDLIRSQPTSGDVMGFALKKGMIPITQDAVEKASMGLTTLEEIKRVLG